MISNQVLQNTIDGLKGITRIDLCVIDTEGKVLASTFPEAGRLYGFRIGFHNDVLTAFVMAAIMYTLVYRYDLLIAVREFRNKRKAKPQID